MDLLEKLDAFRQKDLTEFVQACEADFRGRKGVQDRDYPQGRFLATALEAALAVRAGDLDLGDHQQGPQVGEKLRAARIKAISNIIP